MGSDDDDDYGFCNSFEAKTSFSKKNKMF